jgi:hypothetical protein
MDLFFIPDDLPISEWMLIYFLSTPFLLIILIFLKKGFLYRYMVVMLYLIASCYVFFIGYSFDIKQASPDSRSKLTKCAISKDYLPQSSVWLSLAQDHRTERFVINRQIRKCEASR